MQVSQLNRGRLRLEDFRGVGELLRSFKLALRVNDFCAALALGLGLFGDGALHLLGNVHLLHFHFGDFDAPGFRVGIEYDLKLGVDFVTLGENFIQFELPDDAAESGLRELRRRVLIILDLGEGQIRIHHAEVAHRVDFHGDVVARDDVLRRHVERFQPQTDAIQSFNRP